MKIAVTDDSGSIYLKMSKKWCFQTTGVWESFCSDFSTGQDILDMNCF